MCIYLKIEEARKKTQLLNGGKKRKKIGEFFNIQKKKQRIHFCALI